MSIPFVLELKGVAESALTERAIRHVLFRAEPLAGWIIGEEVRLSRTAAGELELRLTVTLPGARLEATRRVPGETTAEIGIAALQALRAVLLRMSPPPAFAPAVRRAA